MRTLTHYQKMLTDNPDTTIGFTLAADMIYAARHGEIKRSEARGGDEWRTIAKNLKREYGESLSVDEVRSEMSPAKIAAAILGKSRTPKKTAASRANGAKGGRPMSTTSALEKIQNGAEPESLRFICEADDGQGNSYWVRRQGATIIRLNRFEDNETGNIEWSDDVSGWEK
jgi:hypothetical protein